MGLWHGANWTFILWGFYHSIVILLYRLISSYTRKLNQNFKALGGIILTLPVMMLAWIPFRAESMIITVGMWSKVVNPFDYTSLGLRENVYLVTAFILIGIFVTYWTKTKLIPFIAQKNNYLLIIGESLVFSIALPLVIVFLRPINQFIYFQF